jgi:hypothetical protein
LQGRGCLTALPKHRGHLAFGGVERAGQGAIVNQIDAHPRQGGIVLGTPLLQRHELATEFFELLIEALEFALLLALGADDLRQGLSSADHG